MAPRAPKPGTTPNSPGTSDPGGGRRIVIKLGADTLTLHLADLGPTDEMILEEQTGKTFDEVTEKLRHTPNLAAIVWLARRKRGERKLSFRSVLSDFPSREAIAEMGADGTFDIDFLDGDEDDEGDEAPSDPLPNADS